MTANADSSGPPPVAAAKTAQAHHSPAAARTGQGMSDGDILHGSVSGPSEAPRMRTCVTPSAWSESSSARRRRRSPSGPRLPRFIPYLLVVVWVVGGRRILSPVAQQEQRGGRFSHQRFVPKKYQGASLSWAVSCVPLTRMKRHEGSAPGRDGRRDRPGGQDARRTGLRRAAECSRSRRRRPLFVVRRVADAGSKKKAGAAAEVNQCRRGVFIKPA